MPNEIQIICQSEHSIRIRLKHYTMYGDKLAMEYPKKVTIQTKCKK
jgi:hypothetical protein